MNELNYASLEASKKLADNGIVLETDFVWRLGADGWKLLNKDWVTNMMSNTYESYPAPCFADVWRELPDINQGARIYLTKTGNQRLACLPESRSGAVTQVGYGWPYMPSSSVVGQNISPTDALIELLVWLRKEKK